MDHQMEDRSNKENIDPIKLVIASFEILSQTEIMHSKYTITDPSLNNNHKTPYIS